MSYVVRILNFPTRLGIHSTNPTNPASPTSILLDRRRRLHYCILYLTDAQWWNSRQSEACTLVCTGVTARVLTTTNLAPVPSSLSSRDPPSSPFLQESRGRVLLLSILLNSMSACFLAASEKSTISLSTLVQPSTSVHQTVSKPRDSFPKISLT